MEITTDLEPLKTVFAAGMGGGRPTMNEDQRCAIILADHMEKRLERGHKEGLLNVHSLCDRGLVERFVMGAPPSNWNIHNVIRLLPNNIALLKPNGADQVRIVAHNYMVSKSTFTGELKKSQYQQLGVTPSKGSVL